MLYYRMYAILSINVCTRRSLAQSLSDEIYKPMKHLAESQHKHRKPVSDVMLLIVSSICQIYIYIMYHSYC